MTSATHQEAHEVEGEHGGHPPKGQPLQHGAADAGGVAVVLGFALGGAIILAAARLAAAAAQYRHGYDQHGEHAHCHILVETLWGGRTRWRRMNHTK